MKALKENKDMAAKVEKLIAAGVLRMGWFIKNIQYNLILHKYKKFIWSFYGANCVWIYPFEFDFKGQDIFQYLEILKIKR